MFLIGKIIGKKNIDKKLDELYRMFNSEKTKYVNHLTNGVSEAKMKQFQCERSIAEESVELEFEGMMFPCPKEYDKYLKQIYGDYMKLPPENERFPEHNIVNIKLRDDK